MKEPSTNVGSYSRQQIANAFGATLRGIRKDRGISQEALCASCDLDRTYPSLLERGLRHPTLAMLLRLADALHLAPEQLVNDTVARLRGAECAPSGELSSASKHSEKESRMLILTRRPHEVIRVAENIRITVLGIKGAQVRLGIEAPPEVVVDREEVYLRKQAQARQADTDGKSA